MPVHKLTIGNFKGIAERQTFEIRPITVFVGANSSGKSSCLHALASLSQTLKLGNTAPSLTLDDEHAQVHLGRFIEIAHSRDYKEAIELGIDVGEHNIELDDRTLVGSVSAEYTFKSTLRTQEVYIDTARLSVGTDQINIKRGSKKPYDYSGTRDAEKYRGPFARSTNFLFRPTRAKSAGDDIRGWVNTLFFTDNVQQVIEENLRQCLYLGPFRQSPLRRYPFRGSTASEVGAEGESAITMLAGEAIQAQDRPHIRQVNAWLTSMKLAKNMELARVGTSDLFDVKLTLPDGNRLPIADLGYGLSQILPVLVQCSFAKSGATLLFEQPELHLHEGAASHLPAVFRETAVEKDIHIVVETHSKEFIHELFGLIRKKRLKTEDIAIYVVTRADGKSNYKQLQIEFDGHSVEVDDPWVKALA